MALGGTYNTGTISVSADGTVVTGAGTLWSSVAEQGDWLFANGNIGIIASVDDDIQLTLYDPWTGGALVAASYRVVKMSWLRYDPALTQAKLRDLVAALDTPTIIYGVDGAAPDTGIGSDGQYALKSNSGAWKLWKKIAGTWVQQATPLGIVWRGRWDNATPYIENDAVERTGSVYISATVNANQDPLTNPDDWDLFAQAGRDGGFPGISVRYTFDATSAADSDRGPGKLRLNITSPQAAATVIRVDLLDRAGQDASNLLAKLGTGTSAVKYQASLQKDGDPSYFIDFEITAVASPSGYRNISATVIAASGQNAGSPFVNGDAVILACTRVGDKGDQGIQGPQGIQGIQGPQGIQGIQGIVGPQGQGIEPDAAGTLAERAAYDNAAQGFVFLRTDSVPLELYIKASATVGDWSAPSPLGNASIESPAFTGVPTAPTAAPGTDTAQLSTTAFVKAA
jgi:hypothetical protein